MDSLKLYTNKKAQKTVEDMKSSGRLPHSFLIYGDKGTGKKTFAKYLCMLILCESRKAEPCGQCNSCKKILAGVHPDIEYVEHFGKRGGFQKKNLKENVVSDAYIKPNDGDFKIYVFEDCEYFSAETQDVLLKLIEEPPEHAKFIFTSASKNIFLATILSRVTQIEMFAPTREECISAMLDEGADEKTALAILDDVGCNIGTCIRAARGEQSDGDDKLFSVTNEISYNIALGSEYELGLSFFKAAGDRIFMLAVLERLCLLLRDAVVYTTNADITMMSNCMTQTVKLSENCSITALTAILDILKKSMEIADKNVNLPLLSANIAAEISKIREKL